MASTRSSDMSAEGGASSSGTLTPRIAPQTIKIPDIDGEDDDDERSEDGDVSSLERSL
jgi:hypothetical protein